MKIPVLAELGRSPISLKIVWQINAFLTHSIESDDHSNSKQTYAIMLHQQSVIEIPWLKFIKTKQNKQKKKPVLYGIGFGYV